VPAVAAAAPAAAPPPEPAKPDPSEPRRTDPRTALRDRAQAAQAAQPAATAWPTPLLEALLESIGGKGTAATATGRAFVGLATENNPQTMHSTWQSARARAELKKRLEARAAADAKDPQAAAERRAAIQRELFRIGISAPGIFEGLVISDALRQSCEQNPTRLRTAQQLCDRFLLVVKGGDQALRIAGSAGRAARDYVEIHGAPSAELLKDWKPTL
jgi:sulfite reductase alpha subunit-like flavoprotein